MFLQYKVNYGLGNFTKVYKGEYAYECDVFCRKI
jgi:hypothetical protein